MNGIVFLCSFKLICFRFLIVVFFFKQKTAYEMRISDWSSDVCSSDLRGWRRLADHDLRPRDPRLLRARREQPAADPVRRGRVPEVLPDDAGVLRGDAVRGGWPSDQG